MLNYVRQKTLHIQTTHLNLLPKQYPHLNIKSLFI